MQPFERRDQAPKRVIVIGAGMAGLVAGYEGQTALKVIDAKWVFADDDQAEG